MLNVEHVRARRDQDRLVLVRLTEPKRRRAVEIAERVLAAVQETVGTSRAELEAAFARIEVAPAERRLVEGLVKLVEDASEFEQLEGVEPPVIRSELFLRAAAARRAASLEAPFDRSEVLARAGEALALTPLAIEEALYADLRSAQRLIRAPALGAAMLVQRYEQAQVQAVLLRAVEVVARVRCKSPDYYRSLFQKLKFRQLLYRLERLPSGEYSITIDGPFSLFEAVTKYGLELALTLPALEACDELELTARVLWGKSRTPLRFEHHHVSPGASRELAAPLRDDVRTLLDEFQGLGSSWQVAAADVILELPGVGLCVPDLMFRRRGARPIYLELLGYWSRDAVFRRLDLARAGLGEPVIFAVSSKLRVSEALLDGDEPAALYVYRGKASARALERKLDALDERSARES
jgi:hypothetical protein